jgi:hypothetical protein
MDSCAAPEDALWLPLPNGLKRNCSSRGAPEFALTGRWCQTKLKKQASTGSLPASWVRFPFAPMRSGRGCQGTAAQSYRSAWRTGTPGRGRAELPERAEDEDAGSPRRGRAELPEHRRKYDGPSGRGRAERPVGRRAELAGRPRGGACRAPSEDDALGRSAARR